LNVIITGFTTRSSSPLYVIITGLTTRSPIALYVSLSHTTGMVI
jgi:hypothetical protein